MHLHAYTCLYHIIITNTSTQLPLPPPIIIIQLPTMMPLSTSSTTSRPKWYIKMHCLGRYVFFSFSFILFFHFHMLVTIFFYFHFLKIFICVMNTHGNRQINRQFTNILQTFYISLLLHALRHFRTTWCCILGLHSSPFHFYLCFTLTWCCTMLAALVKPTTCRLLHSLISLPIKTYIDCSYSLVCSLFLIYSNINTLQPSRL